MEGGGKGGVGERGKEVGMGSRQLSMAGRVNTSRKQRSQTHEQARLFFTRLQRVHWLYAFIIKSVSKLEPRVQVKNALKILIITEAEAEART